ncbi:MAG: hypothetical protein U0Y10_23085 [Spirosomataceae bacterium]
MKKIAMLALVAVTFVQCSKEETQPSLSLNETIKLKVGQSASLPEVNPELTLKLNGAQDSRCPANAMCIWAGNAVAKFSLSDKQSSKEVELWLGDYRGAAGAPGTFKTADSTDVTLGSKSYRLILKEIGPYPTTTNGDEIKDATVILKSL